MIGLLLQLIMTPVCLSQGTYAAANKLLAVASNNNYIFFNIVTLAPNRSVSTIDGQAAFICSHASLSITSIQWLLNGSALRTENDPFGGVGMLQLNDLTQEYNVTQIQCRATIITEETFLSNVGLLLIQGALWNQWKT